MSAYEWVERITVLTTLPFWALGFGYTIAQVRKAKTAAEAARDAVNAAADAIAGRQSLLLLAMLHKVESDIEQAVDAADGRLVIYQLSLWRWQAGQLRMALDIEQPDHRRIAKRIQSSITQSGDAKMIIMDGKVSVGDATRKAREAIASVTGELGALAWTRVAEPVRGTND